MVELGSHDWRDRKVREWLLLLLRFAVTREPSDQSAALAMAVTELLGAAVEARGATFSGQDHEVCRAILAVNDGHNSAVLKMHAARIADPRLRRAFQAAVGFQQASTAQQESRERKAPNLWKGLPKS